MGGFDVSREGLCAAAAAGYMRIQKSSSNGVHYLDVEEGVAYLEKENFDVQVSFPVNRRSSAFLMATEKNGEGHFIVTALSTDGGCIPRNFLLSHGMNLVRFDALTLPEFVTKCSWNPAMMLGLEKKGHLSVGADGDLVVVDPYTHKALLTVANGRIVMMNGVVLGSGGTIVTTEQGKKKLEAQNVPISIANLAGGLFYNS
jgi:imidazolonepropionase-like amidohydrolase